MNTTLPATIDALNTQGTAFFDALDYDPFDETEDGEEEADELANFCPLHGPHETGEDGTPLSYCERCERFEGRW